MRTVLFSAILEINLDEDVDTGPGIKPGEDPEAFAQARLDYFRDATMAARDYGVAVLRIHDPQNYADPEYLELMKTGVLIREGEAHG